MFTGKLIERKGVIPLLKAWKQHVKIWTQDTLVLVGDGELMAECQELSTGESSIYVEGRVDYDKVHQYYAIADVYFLPTIEDNWSLVIPEAMACGLPVATSIYNGCHKELVEEGENGVTFDTFNKVSIANALSFFHGKDLVRMGLKSVEIERRFDTEKCAFREYEAIINSI